MGILKAQFEIILALSNHFGTKQCVFVELGDISAMKQMSAENIFSTVTTTLIFEKLSQNSFSSRILVVELRTVENQTFANVLNFDYVALGYFS